MSGIMRFLKRTHNTGVTGLYKCLGEESSKCANFWDPIYVTE